MAGPTLSLTRDQFASFLSDFEQIKQFERLFANTNANSISIDDVSISAGNAGGSANDALAQIIELSETLDKEPAPANVSQLAVIETQLQALGIAPPASNGSVTSVAASGGTTGLTFSGSPITTSGTLTLGGTLALASGGTGATSAITARAALGSSTLGDNLFIITNPSAVTFPRFNADNTVSALDAATFRTAIGAGTGGGSVTSVSGTGTVNGITLTGTVTSSGSLTLGGTLSGVSLTTQVSGTLPIANGGTNGTSAPTAGAVPYGTGTAYAFTAAGTSGQVLTSAGAGVPTWTTPTTGTVTSVTGTAPVVSSGGSTPAISMAAATTSVNGYLTSTDWNTFNGKQATLVSGTNIKTVGGVSLLGSGDVGTIGATYGGTGTATAFTAGSVVFAGTSGVYSQNNTNFFWDNTNSRLGVGTASPASKLDIGSGDLRFSSTGQRILGDMSNATITSRFAFQTTTVNGSTNVHIIPNGTSVIAGLKVESDSAVTTGQVMAIDMVGGNDARISSGIRGAGAYVPLTFYTSAAERMRIDTSGNVGVGTVSPSTYGKMAVSGNVANEASALGVADASTVSIINLADSALNQKASLVLRSNPNSRAAIAGYYAAFNGAGDTATGLIFGTQATAAGGVLERMRIDQNGNVGIGATANASALLDVQSTTKGFRLPNMTTTQKNAISSPAAGLMVFDTTLAKACVYSGAAWQTITSI